MNISHHVTDELESVAPVDTPEGRESPTPDDVPLSQLPTLVPSDLDPRVDPPQALALTDGGAFSFRAASWSSSVSTNSGGI